MISLQYRMIFKASWPVSVEAILLITSCGALFFSFLTFLKLTVELGRYRRSSISKHQSLPS
jgi:hypothetical protein